MGPSPSPPPVTALRLSREGVPGKSWQDIAEFSLSRFDAKPNPKTQLDIGLTNSSDQAITNVLSLGSDGTANLNGGLNAAAIKVTGNCNFSSLTITSRANLNSLNVVESSILNSLTVANNANLNGLSVTGTCDLNSLTVANNTNLNNLTVAGSSNLSSLTVTNTSELKTLSVTNSATFQGATIMEGPLNTKNVCNLKGGATIQNRLTVLGKANFDPRPIVYKEFNLLTDSFDTPTNYLSTDYALAVIAGFRTVPNAANKECIYKELYISIGNGNN